MLLKVPLALAGILFAFLVAPLAVADDEMIPSSGGQYFASRVELSVPAFAQDDPRWSDDKLGPSLDTMGDEGCAVTSAAMVAAFYGIETDPGRLNIFLTRNGGFTEDGLIHWRMVPTIAPKRMELAYNGAAAYDRIDANLLAKNPVIVWLPLPGGAYHFVVIVGKTGHEYLIRNPAGSPFGSAHRLSQITDRIGGLCYFHLL